MKPDEQAQVGGSLWLNREERSFLGKGRIQLMEAIRETGSITKAAKSMKMSYKAAWDAIDAMNNLSEQPLVERSTGGKGGGGTRLTPHGEELIAVYRSMEREHDRFLEQMTEKIRHFDRFYPLLQRISMRTSARNQLSGTIESVKGGSVNTIVTLALKGEDKVEAVVTNESVADLGLAPGLPATAIVKASWVMLSASPDAKLSVRNRLCGKVAAIHSGSVNCEVTLELKGGSTITAIVTNDSAKEMTLHLGAEACALFQAGSVILGV